MITIKRAISLATAKEWSNPSRASILKYIDAEIENAARNHRRFVEFCFMISPELVAFMKKRKFNVTQYDPISEPPVLHIAW